MGIRYWLDLLDDANILIPKYTNDVYNNLDIDLEDMMREICIMSEYAQQIGYEDSEFLVFTETTINFCIAYDL